MRLLHKKLWEARSVFWSIKFYRVILDFFAAFLAFAIVFKLLDRTIFYALVPAAMFAALRLIIEFMRGDMSEKLRGKYENLNERLSTALENENVDNIIVSDLLFDVSERMDKVESSAFFDKRDISHRVLTIMVCAFLLLTVTAFDLRNLTLDSLKRILDDPAVRHGVNNLNDGVSDGLLKAFGEQWEMSNWTSDKELDKLGGEGGGEKPGESEGPIPGSGGGVGENTITDIYGEASAASLFGRDIDFRIRPEYGGEIEIRQTGSQEAARRFTLDEVNSVEECQECAIAPENEQLVRGYFERILPES